MTSIAVLIIGFGIVLLVIWTIRNESAGKVGEQRGLFSMRDWTAEAAQEGEVDAQKGGRQRRLNTERGQRGRAHARDQIKAPADGGPPAKSKAGSDIDAGARTKTRPGSRAGVEDRRSNRPSRWLSGQDS